MGRVHDPPWRDSYGMSPWAPRARGKASTAHLITQQKVDEASGEQPASHIEDRGNSFPCSSIKASVQLPFTGSRSWISTPDDTAFCVRYPEKATRNIGAPDRGES
ncbi:hypothetical protein ABKV19_009184 [Rosa sericea]